MVYRLNSVDELTLEMVRKMVVEFRGQQLPRLKKLKDYYMNKTAILRRVQADKTKPNNRIVHPFAQYITDTLTGYFMGEPVAYTSEIENIEPLKMVFQYNDEQDENMSLAKNASIYGEAWEYIYVDKNGDIRFTSIDTQEVIPIYSTTVEDELIAVVRFYPRKNLATETTDLIVELYTDKDIITYQCSDAVEQLHEVSRQPHAFNSVPFVEYKNNDDCYGDFEGVMTLIDAYDALVSDDLNDFEYFCDCYLALYGYQGTEEEDIAAMKQARVLLLDENTKAEWLVKQGNGADVETNKSRIEQDIHKFSKTPNSKDTSFGSNVSGVAMRYKLLGTENVGSIKERKFKRGLTSRLEKLAYIMQLMSRESFDWRGVDIVFTRNLPVNEDEIATMVSNLKDIVSTRTLVAQLPFVEDADQEVRQLQAEQSARVNMVSGFGQEDKVNELEGSSQNTD